MSSATLDGPGRWLRATVEAMWRILVFLLLSAAAVVVLAWLLSPFRGAGFSGVLLGMAEALVGFLAGTWAVLRLVERRPLGAVGFHGQPTAAGEALRGAALGAAVTASFCGVLIAAGWLSFEPAEGTALEGLARGLALTLFTILAAAWEELVFRGYPFQVLAARLGLPIAVAVSAGLFAFAHLSNPELTPLALVNLALAGGLLAVAYLRTRSLWFATGVHAGWNWVLLVPLDQPVSGWVFGMPGYDVRATGPELLTGGAFGPEGGWVATVATLGAVAWIARTRRLRRSPAAEAVGSLLEPAGEPARRGTADAGS